MQPKYPKQQTPVTKYPKEIPRRPIPFAPVVPDGRVHGSESTWICHRCKMANGLHARSCADCGDARPNLFPDGFSVIAAVRRMIQATSVQFGEFHLSDWKLIFEMGALIEFRNEVAKIGGATKEEMEGFCMFDGIRIVVLPGIEPGDIFLLPKER